MPKTGPQRRALARTPVENRSRRTGSRPTGNGDRGTATIASEQSTRTPGATTDKNTKSYRDAALKSSTPSEIIKNTGKPAAPNVADLWDAIGGVEETSIKEEPALQITAVKRFLERLLAKIGRPHLPVAMLQGTTPQHNRMATVIIPPRRVTLASLGEDAEARTQATAIRDGETDESSSSDSGDGMCEDDQSVTLHQLYEYVRKHVGTWAVIGATGVELKASEVRHVMSAKDLPVHTRTKAEPGSIVIQPFLEKPTKAKTDAKARWVRVPRWSSWEWPTLLMDALEKAQLTPVGVGIDVQQGVPRMRIIPHTSEYVETLEWLRNNQFQINRRRQVSSDSKSDRNLKTTSTPSLRWPRHT